MQREWNRLLERLCLEDNERQLQLRSLEIQYGQVHCSKKKIQLFLDQEFNYLNKSFHRI
jgi:hypothetical protein